MPALIMIPKTSSRSQQSHHQPPKHTYSVGEESFDSIMARNTFFGKTRSGNPLVEDDDDGFDPFKIGDAGGKNNNAVDSDDPFANETKEDSIGDSGSAAPALIPPKLLVKFKVNEEVSSVAPLAQDGDGESRVYVQGTVQAQIVSSDALKNAPFMLSTTIGNDNSDSDDDKRQEEIEFQPNELYTKEFMSKESKVNNIVKIPKDIVGFVNVGTYNVLSKVQHMPLLLEQKVVRSKSKIQVAIQVRSKLTNPDDLTKFTIVVSIPAKVNSNSIAISSGSGQFDRTKRCITWEMPMLPKGESFMMSAKCELDDTAENSEAMENESLDFPVMLRCSSNDQISGVRFEAVQASGYPANVSSSVVGQSFRIIHRLR